MLDVPVLIAAEGARSQIRRSLGVRMIGEEKVYDSVNILFHADLGQWTEHRPAALYFVEQPALRWRSRQRPDNGFDRFNRTPPRDS